MLLKGENVTLIKRYKLKKRLYLISFIYYMFGFLLWNIDNKFCDVLKTYRANVESFFHLDSAPEWQKVIFNCIIVTLKALSEFHSLWHIFTGYAAFMTILFIVEVHFQHFLITNESKHYKSKRPVASSACNFYYYLSDNLLTISNENEPKRKTAKTKRI